VSAGPAGGFVSRLRTGAWHGERTVALEFPAGWEVAEHWPVTPAPLDEESIRERILRPIGQPPLHQACRGKTRPVIIVDDLNRPTPAWRVMPYLLEELRRGGIEPAAVTIVMATGTHGAPRPGDLEKKVGPQAAAGCRLEIHDSSRSGRSLGTTSYGTPVVVNRTVAASDFLIGVGGIYPNHTAGFGGGAKLALGVLTTRSIARLHYRHESMGWGILEGENHFRRDLEAIAQLIGLNTTLSLQVDPRGEIVRLACGDHRQYFPEEVRFARETFAAPPPGEADVLVANAFPNDMSLTFARMKGTAVFAHGRPAASRIVIAALTEGGGHHGLFPVVNVPRFYGQLDLARRMAVMDPGQIAAGVARKVWRKAFGRPRRLEGHPVGTPPGPAELPIWVYCTAAELPALPAARGVKVSSSWAEILDAVRLEQGGRRDLRVALYPCTPLQWIDASRAASPSETVEQRTRLQGARQGG
jgi:nickel-dependent lactate racemase